MQTKKLQGKSTGISIMPTMVVSEWDSVIHHKYRYSSVVVNYDTLVDGPILIDCWNNGDIIWYK